jgi:uncharacterized membrane protein YdbT with pleckstrin-like domain
MTTSGPDFISSPSPNTSPHAAPDDREEVYFQGSPLVRATIGKLSLYFLIALALFALAGLLIHKGWGPWWITAIIIVIGLAVPWIPRLSTTSIRYRITNYRIDYERGLLAKNIDTLELWHVEDLEFHQSLFDRIQNVGTITVISKDDKMPTLVIWGLPNPRPLYETLKQRVIAVKRQRGVIKMDPG